LLRNKFTDINMKFKELKNQSEAELKKLKVELQDKLRDLRFKIASRQLKNVRETREAKKTIARVMTLLANFKNNKEHKG